jgi:hypothetical protein
MFKRHFQVDAYWCVLLKDVLRLIYALSSTADTTLYFRDDDEFLIRFLRPTKFYPESALQLVSKYSSTSEYVRFGISPTRYTSCLDVKNFAWYTTFVWNMTRVLELV